jgi:hypothetical protein
MLILSFFSGHNTGINRSSWSLLICIMHACVGTLKKIADFFFAIFSRAAS